MIRKCFVLVCMFIRCTCLGGGMSNAFGQGTAAPTGTEAFTLDNVYGWGVGGWTLGFTFHANEDIVIRHLGLFDHGQDGLHQSHDVGLWDNTGTLLASGTIGSGTTARLTNQFRYVAVAPVVLQAGRNYVIGASYPSGNQDGVVWIGQAVNFATDPAITFVQPSFGGGDVLTYPSRTVSDKRPGYFGPNFQFYNEVPIVDAGEDQYLDCTGPDGALVQLDGSGCDPDGDDLTFEWSMAGGTAEFLDVHDPQTLALCAIGENRLILTVSDGMGGVATDEVVITVYPTPEVLIEDLIDYVAELNLTTGVSNSLDVKIQNALDALDAANADNRNDAVNKLWAFINSVEAQAEKKITREQADELINAALQIIAMLM